MRIASSAIASNFSDLLRVEITLFLNSDGIPAADISISDNRRLNLTLAALPVDALNRSDTPKMYGAKLSLWLFVPEMEELLLKIIERTERYSNSNHANGVRLQICLSPELPPSFHQIRWETLEYRGIQLSVEWAFSRLMRLSSPVRQPSLRFPKRMISIVADPDCPLDQLDYLIQQTENKSLGPLQSLIDIDPRSGRNQSFLQFKKTLSENLYDIVQFVAYASFNGQQAWLAFRNEDGEEQLVSFEEIRDQFGNLPDKVVPYDNIPYLVVLVTPLKGQLEDGTAWLRLAPMLLSVGVQAVVAITAPIKEDCILIFLGKFYELLLQTGSIDSAFAEARYETKQQYPDGWEWVYPVLYVRNSAPKLYGLPIEYSDNDLLSNFASYIKKIDIL